MRFELNFLACTGTPSSVSKLGIARASLTSLRPRGVQLIALLGDAFGRTGYISRGDHECAQSTFQLMVYYTIVFQLFINPAVIVQHGGSQEET